MIIIRPFFKGKTCIFKVSTFASRSNLWFSSAEWLSKQNPCWHFQRNPHRVLTFSEAISVVFTDPRWPLITHRAKRTSAKPMWHSVAHAVLINILLLSCCFGYAAECTSWERVPETWSVGLLKKGFQVSLLSTGVGTRVSPLISPPLSLVLYLHSGVRLLCTMHVSTQACLPACAFCVYISLCTGTDGPGIHHPFLSRVFAWCLPTTDGLNHRPFWAWHGTESVGTWEIRERADGQKSWQELDNGKMAHGTTEEVSVTLLLFLID